MPVINGRPTVLKRADLLRAEFDPSYQPVVDKIQRDADPLTLGPRQGLYYQNDIENPLFDICSDEDLVSLTMVDRYDPLLDVIGFRNSSLHRREKNIITYMDADGTGAGTPVDYISTDACAPGEHGEFGYCKWVCQGFTEFKATTEPYNLADIGLKLCERYPTFRFDGSQIDNDYEWGLVTTTQAMLKGVHRWFIEGTGYSASAQTPGMAELIDFGYIDPDGNACPAMDSTVLDLLGQGCSPAGGLSGNETVNGTPIGTAGFTLIDYIQQFVINTVQRIRRSQWEGQRPIFIGIIDPNALQCLIDCYICHTECGGRVLDMEELSVRQMLNDMRRQIAFNGTVTMTFSGYPITFYTYDYGLVTDAVNSLSQFFIGALFIGGNKTVGFEPKDFRNALSNAAGTTETGEKNVTDQGRMLSYTDWDHLCFRTTAHMHLRLCVEVPWAWMKVENFLCRQLIPFSGDPQNPNFFGGNPPQVAAPLQP